MIRRFLPFLALTALLTSTAFAAKFSTNRPSTTNNDDSCDIAVLPAATLLIPYFEVEYGSPASVAKTTIFTVINVTRNPQIARVTIWTDWGYPALNFNVFLTGYDIQAINLYDVLARGIVAPPNGTSNRTTPGARSLSNTGGNANFLPDAAETCGGNGIFVQLPANILQDIQRTLSVGTSSLCPNSNNRVGGSHESYASGYVTIDLVANCSYKRPIDEGYFGELLYDNVLTGDYDMIAPNPATGNYAGGNPMVHIRTEPEGGPAGNVASTGLPYTFYDRFTPGTAKKIDRRQPLPSTFAARYIQGGAQAFNTDFHIWREGVTSASAECSLYINNRSLSVTETVRFDERENATTIAPPVIEFPSGNGFTFPAASRVSSTHTNFAPLTSGDIAGWMYLNLNSQGLTQRASQNFVTVNMSAEGRFSTMFDATMLGNGCSPAKLAPTTGGNGSNPIGPAGND